MFSVLVNMNCFGGSEKTALKKIRASFITDNKQNTNIKVEKNSIILVIFI